MLTFSNSTAARVTMKQRSANELEGIWEVLIPLLKEKDVRLLLYPFQLLPDLQMKVVFGAWQPHLPIEEQVAK